MSRLIFSLLHLLRLVRGLTDCDDFYYDGLCYLYPPSNILGAIPDLDSEIACQVECNLTEGCGNFTYEVFMSGGSECFLFNSCDMNSISCSNDSDCKMSVSGPRSPDIMESCCDVFKDSACERESEIGEIFNVLTEEMCQNLCRDEKNCSYWTLFVDVCFLYSSCDNPQHCSSCTSGPSYPDINQCKDRHTEPQQTLLLGGKTADSTSSIVATNTIDLITPNKTCTPDMAPLPVAHYGAAAVVLDSTIFYCGGYNDEETPAYHATCYSYILGHGSDEWHQEDSMNYNRRYFSMSVVGDTIYALGGLGDYTERDYHSTVEYFTRHQGWLVADKMTMGGYRAYHCSVVMGSRLVVIGGVVGGGLGFDSVQYYDTADTNNNTWVKMEPLIQARYAHGCQVGQLEKHEGIFVSGGSIDPSSPLSSVEFYVASVDHWRSLGAMQAARDFHSLTIVGGQLVAAGGYNQLASVETMVGGNWVHSYNLSVARDYHAAVTIHNTYITCLNRTTV